MNNNNNYYFQKRQYLYKFLNYLYSVIFSCNLLIILYIKLILNYISKSVQNPIVSQFQSFNFFVRYRRTFFLNNTYQRLRRKINQQRKMNMIHQKKKILISIKYSRYVQIFDQIYIDLSFSVSIVEGFERTENNLLLNFLFQQIHTIQKPKKNSNTKILTLDGLQDININSTSIVKRYIRIIWNHLMVGLYIIV